MYRLIYLVAFSVVVFHSRINLPLFSTVVPSDICMFLFCRPFVVIQHYQQVLWVLKLLLSLYVIWFLY